MTKRKVKRITSKMLAEHLGVHYQTVYQMNPAKREEKMIEYKKLIESGSVKNPLESNNV